MLSRKSKSEKSFVFLVFRLFDFSFVLFDISTFQLFFFPFTFRFFVFSVFLLPFQLFDLCT